MKAFAVLIYTFFISLGIWASYFLFGYLINFWSTFFGHPNTLPFIAQLIGSIVFSELIFPAAILTWLFQSLG